MSVLPDSQVMIHLAQPKWLMFVSAGLLLCGALLVAGSSRTEQRAKALPRMSCQDLLRMGRAAPQFVTLSDVQLCQNGYASRRDMDAAMEMYVPVFSTKLKNQPRPADLVLLLEVLDDRDRERLLGQPAIGELTVELWTDPKELDPWVGDTLATIYPGIQLANCRVLSVGLHEPSEVRARREKSEGIGMLLVAAACQLAWYSWRLLQRFPRPLAVAVHTD
jgi:hypothetical protein